MSKAKRTKRGPGRKESTHERIVEAASRAIRRNGYDGIGVAEIMKEAGLTHGGFYAHFKSRDEMVAEAVKRAGTEAQAMAMEVAKAASPGDAIGALMRFYLSKEHAESAETGCPMAALGSEVPRQPAAVRKASTDHLKEMIDLVDRLSGDGNSSGAKEEALVIVAAAVGALMLARGVDDPKLSSAIRQAVINHFGTKQG